MPGAVLLLPTVPFMYDGLNAKDKFCIRPDATITGTSTLSYEITGMTSLIDEFLSRMQQWARTVTSKSR